jgi:hypothetical protein
MQFPASAASSLIEGYCGDFVSLAAVLAQTLEQVSIRGIDIERSRPALERTERGMRQLAEAIQDLLQKLPRQHATATPEPIEAPESPRAAAPAATIPSDAVNDPHLLDFTTSAPGAARPPAPASMPTDAAADQRTERGNGRSGKTTSLRVDMRPPELQSPDAPASTPAPKARATEPPTALARPRPNGLATPPAPSEPAPPPPSQPTTGRTETRIVAAPSNRPRAATGPLPKPAPPPAAAPSHPSRPGGRRDTAKPEGIKGNSQSMPLLSVFQFLGRLRKVGTMKVTLPGEEILFELENGCVSFTSSDHCPREERLGELLIEADACSRADVDRVLAKVDAGSTELFGQLAIHENIVTKEQVLLALEEQVRRRFTRACRHTDANYEFLQDVRNSIEHRFRIQPVTVG